MRTDVGISFQVVAKTSFWVITRAATVQAHRDHLLTSCSPANPPPMLPAPQLPHDEQRLDALRRLLVLDTPPEERFDKITAFAAQEFDVPIVLVSLVDRQRQWFKSRLGLDAVETPRDISFCGHAVAAATPVFVVADAATDPRFADNPLVTGDPDIRFYAGAPLILPGGHKVGTLCLIAREPRVYDEVDQAIHLALRDLVVEELLRREAHP